jgi:hypothetical protein
MLDPDVHRLWLQYTAAERDRIQDVVDRALNAFIDAILRQDLHDWQSWALDFARSVSGESVSASARLPLFRRVLLPALAGGIQRREPGCARTLASFHLLLCHCGEELCQLPEHLRTYTGLLQEALRVDPADELAKRRLIEAEADYLEFTIHEVPRMVLSEGHAATAQECDELLELLAEFRRRVSSTCWTKEFEDLIVKCEFHYRSYRAFLGAGRPGNSYERYIAWRGSNHSADGGHETDAPP